MKHFVNILLSASALMAMAGCLVQTKNSVSGDQMIYNPEPTTRFGKAQKILAQHCIECHANFPTLTESEFEAHMTEDGIPLVAAGDLARSALYVDLAKEGDPDGDMPKNRTALSAAEVAKIADRITNIGVAPVSNPVATVSPVTPPESAPATPVVVVPVVPKEPTPAEQRFASAKLVIQTNCIKCHGVNSDHGDFATYTTEAQFKEKTTSDSLPLLTPKNLEHSEIYARLKGSGFSGADMPKRATLSADDLKKIADWIENID